MNSNQVHGTGNLQRKSLSPKDYSSTQTGLVQRSSERDSAKVKQRTNSRVLNNDLAYVIPSRKSRILFQNKTKEQKVEKQTDGEQQN